MIYLETTEHILGIYIYIDMKNGTEVTNQPYDVCVCLKFVSIPPTSRFRGEKKNTWTYGSLRYPIISQPHIMHISIATWLIDDFIAHMLIHVFLVKFLIPSKRLFLNQPPATRGSFELWFLFVFLVCFLQSWMGFIRFVAFLEATASQKTSLFWEDMDQIKVVECMNGMLNMKQWQKTMVDHGGKFWSTLFFHTHIIASAVS